MGNMDLEKTEKKFEKLKKSLKKKRPKTYIALSLILLYFVFMTGAFLNESKFVENLNIVMVILGQKNVDIDFAPFPNVGEDRTTIPFHVTNIGDKDIDEVTILYTFCGLGEEKAILEKKKLYRDETISFNVETPIILNTSCQYYTNKIWADVYEDNQKNCYLDILDDITENYCSFCKVRFKIYLDGEKKEEEAWYPYLGDSLNAGDFMRNLLVQFNLNISWKQGYSSECKILVPNTSKNGLIKKESLGLGFFDTYTMCARGEDLEWCKENFYEK